MTCNAATNCAWSRMKTPERARRTPTRRSAQWTGFRWKTTPSAHPTATPANIPKRIPSSMAALSLHRQHDGGDGQVEKRGRKEHLPTERHELVIAEPRERRPEPDVEEEEERELDQEPDRPRQRRAVPRPEEAGDGHGGDDHHVRVLGEVVEGEAHRRELGMEAGHQLGLGFGQVE